MIKHKVTQSKKCPKCGKQFECKANSIESCECNHIKLSKETLETIAKKYTSCLCFDCLKTIKNAN